MSSLTAGVIASAGSALLAFVLTMVSYREENIVQAAESLDTISPTVTGVIYAPIAGKVIPLSEVEDEAFQSGSLGDGLAVIPEHGEVYAPVDGEINVMFPTGHAIGLTGNDGVEVLIHVGFNTVSLNGKYFTPVKQQGDRVKKGELLLKFDKKGIEGEGYSTVTPVIISNSYKYASVKKTDSQSVAFGDKLLEPVKTGGDTE